MTDDQSALSLHPDHLADLKKSGLSNETLRGAGIYSVPPRDIAKKLGFNDSLIESALAFPYPGCDGFERYKVFPPRGGKKYLQPIGSKNHLYIPERVRPILLEPSITLYITEGEKKTLKAVQEGLPCIGLSGLWNWKNKGEEGLISDFNLIAWQGRSVYMIPDSDWLEPNHHGYRKNLKEAVRELSYRLIDRGARVFIVELPKEVSL